MKSAIGIMTFLCVCAIGCSRAPDDQDASAPGDGAAAPSERQAGAESVQTSQQLIRATYRLADMERFKPPRRSTAEAPARDSEEGKRRIAEAHSRAEARREQMRRNVARDRKTAEAWMAHARKTYQGNKRVLALLGALERELTPKEPVMKDKIRKFRNRSGPVAPVKSEPGSVAERDIELLTFAELDREYRRCYVGNLAQQLTQFEQELNAENKYKE